MDIEKLEALYIVVGNVKWCKYCRKKMRFFKKLNIDLPYNPATPLTGYT